MQAPPSPSPAHNQLPKASATADPLLSSTTFIVNLLHPYQFLISPVATKMVSRTNDSQAQAASTPEPRPEQVRYLTPTPPGFSPEIDYLATVQSLGEAAGLDKTDSAGDTPYQFWGELFRRWTLRIYNATDSRALLIDASGYPEHIETLTKKSGTGTEVEIQAKHVYEMTQYLRHKLIDEVQEGTRVLMVDKVDPILLQALGAAFDLDPTFIIRNYSKEYESNEHASEMSTLRKEYHAFTARKKQSEGSNKNAQNHVLAEEWDHGVHIRGEFPGNKMRSISSNISCCRVSANGCQSY